MTNPDRRLRRLGEEEITLWLSVAASVTRRDGAALPERAPAPPAMLAPVPVPDAPTIHRKPAAVPAWAPPLAPLERKLKQKLSRGRATADAALDLHGFRQAEALDVLRRFLRRAQRDGLKVVLVVTGKGGRRPDEGYGGDDAPFFAEVGVLRRAVPLWLSGPEFRPLVVGFEEAGRSHGGTGALYVRLRKGEPAADPR